MARCESGTALTAGVILSTVRCNFPQHRKFLGNVSQAVEISLSRAATPPKLGRFFSKDTPDRTRLDLKVRKIQWIHMVCESAIDLYCCCRLEDMERTNTVVRRRFSTARMFTVRYTVMVTMHLRALWYSPASSVFSLKPVCVRLFSAII